MTRGEAITSLTRGQLEQDARFAIRQLAAARSFTAAAVATLAIGIGATASVFSVVEAVVLRPLPFAEPDRVVDLHPAHDGAPVATASNLEFATWRALPRAFDGVVAIVPPSAVALERGDAPEVISGGRSTSELTRVFGIMPELGRGFSSGDDLPGAPHVIILSHKLWLRDYNGDRSILGQRIRLDGISYAVIGVMPASFDAVSAGSEVWVPLTLSSTDLLDFKVRYLQLVARLGPGVSLSQATAAVDGSERILGAQNPMWGRGYTGQVSRYADDMIGNVRARLFILLGAVSFVFLIAGVNVANLVLARGSTRAREMAIRATLGADRGRLIRQMLTESAVLCGLGGTIGVVVALGLVRGLVAASPPGVPRIDQARVDAPVLIFTVLASALCSVIVGLLPAIRAARPGPQATLRDGGRGASESKPRLLARDLLVAVQVALAMALLSGAGLLIRTAWEITHVDPGFDSRHVLTAQVLLPPARYPDRAAGTVAYRSIRESVAQTPGVESAALTSSVPLGPTVRAGVGAEGQPLTDGERLIAPVRMVTPGYFSTMKIRLRAGRDFATTDDSTAPAVAIINAALASRLWPGERAIGRRMEGMDPSHRHFMEVIGVIADPRDVGLEQPPTPEFYIPIEQTPPPAWAGLQGSLILVVRAAPEPAAMERAIRQAVDAVDPSLPIANMATMDELVKTSRAAAHFNTLLLSVLGTIALVLASVGVYGVIAYSVSQRTREIGVRMALGATPAAIAALIVGRGFAPIGIGVVAGGLLSEITTRLLRDQLYGVAPGDPTTILSIGALLLTLSLLATGLPTLRAMNTSPTAALAA